MFWYEEISSTMDVAAGLQTQSETGIVVADRQRAGRGRYGRRWVSPHGGLYLSWFFPSGERFCPHLLEIGSISVVRSLTGAGCPGCRIKFPNDIICGGRKIAGLLIQRCGNRTILGAGVNLNSASTEIGPWAVSCYEVSGKMVQREVFLASLIRAFKECAGRCLGGDDACLKTWAELLLP